MSDEYISSIISKHKLPTGLDTKVYQAAHHFIPIIRRWAGGVLENIAFIGSYTKNTRVIGSTEMDFLISLDIHTCGTLNDLYENLFSYLESEKMNPKRKNFSIRLIYSNVSFELFLTRKPSADKEGNMLFNGETQACLETNVHKHTDLVTKSERMDEIMALKIWRNLHHLKFPTLYLELTVLNALFNRKKNRLEKNFLNVMDYLIDRFIDDEVRDPANHENIVSGLLTHDEKKIISDAARVTRNQADWGNIIW